MRSVLVQPNQVIGPQVEKNRYCSKTPNNSQSGTAGRRLFQRLRLAVGVLLLTLCGALASQNNRSIAATSTWSGDANIPAVHTQRADILDDIIDIIIDIINPPGDKTNP